MEDAGAALANKAIAKLALSGRGYHRTLKVVRTIADLADQVKVGAIQVAEASQYRRLDRAQN